MKTLLFAIGFVILAIVIYMYITRHSSASTPSSTPSSTSTSTTGNVSTPVTSPVSSPVSSPVTTPVSSPVTSPVSTPVSTSVTSALSNYREVINSDMNINDIIGSSFTANSEEACASACNSLAECSMFAYTTGGQCYPKRTVADPSGNLAIKKGDGTYNVLNLRDFYGFDIKSYTNVTQDQCKQYCDSSADCALYRYNNGSCWIKSPAAKSGVDMYYRKS